MKGSPISPTRCTFPLPKFDFSPKCTPPRTISYVDGNINCQQFLPILPLKDTVPRITSETLVQILEGDYDDYYDNLFILDCRYEYEFNGGHIKGALHIDSPDEFQKMFFDSIIPNSLIIFHCEFSQNRGPQMASFFREMDRNLNKMEYPNLFYPNVYILDGGYKNFYAKHTEYCEGGYTRMLDHSHRENGDLVSATTHYRKNIEKIEDKNRKALGCVPNSKTTSSIFQSPISSEYTNNSSPVVSKRLNFLMSPTLPKEM